ncbi:MAG: DUF6036 family nucleotidyltransferase [Thermoanaerobaculaceae bacterium]|jgi:hypothetical protein
MSDQESALLALAALLEKEHVPYMVIGGLANAVWGEPRATLDIDVTVWVDESGVAGAVDVLSKAFQVVAEDPLAFVKESRVLPLESEHGVRLDVVFGLLPFERDAIARAVPIEIAGMSVRVCTPEDLILMKIISDRERDLADAEGVTLRRIRDLDLGYLEPRIRELADLLGKAEIIRRWESWKANAVGHR